MAMGKVIKKDANPGFFAQGGKTKMFGHMTACPQKPFQTAQEGGFAGDSGGKWGKGGTTKMFGKGHANPAPKNLSIKDTQG